MPLLIAGAWTAACTSSVNSGPRGGPALTDEVADASSVASATTLDASAAPDMSAGAPPRLSISGKHILGPDGKPVVLRGYNWGQWGTAQPQDGAENAAQGATAVRLPLRWWGEWKPGVDSRSSASPGHIAPEHLAVLDQAVRWATSAHLWVVLFVDSNYGQGANGREDNFWTTPSRKQEFAEVWRFLVERYSKTPYIGAFEILPEPHALGVSDGEVKVFYDSIIPVIRAIDNKTPVVVGPNDSYNLRRLEAAYTTVDPAIIYTGNYFIFDNELSPMRHIDAFRAAHDVPLWINQVGIQSGDEGSESKARSVLSGLNDRNVGWAWWTYRALTTNPNQHGIYHLDPTDETRWVVKPTWLSLVGQYL